MGDIRRDVIGGQALIEGVMMINKNKVAMAARTPEGKIVLKKDKTPKILEKKFMKIPIIRGFVRLFSMLYVGMKALNWSSDVALEEEESMSGFWTVIWMIGSFVIAILIFKFLPLFLANSFRTNVNSNYYLFNLVDGFIKIAIFVLYVWGISFLKDVHTLFQYHGAEHKTVYCYEKGLDLTVKNVKKFTTLHPRCGTAFIMIVLLFSIAVYTIIPEGTTLSMKLLLRVLLLPIIAGISYEFLRLSAKYNNNFFVSLMIKPGLWLQKITTQEPDEKQIEVAIKSMKAVI